MFLCIACTEHRKKVSEEAARPAMIRDITETILERADSLLTSLTLEERVGQCLMPALEASENAENIHQYKKYIEDCHIGGVVLMKGDLKSARRISEIGSEAKIPLFIAIDAEWGLGMRLVDAPVYPRNGNIDKNSEDTELFDYGIKISKECEAAGINMVLGPVVDVSPSYLNVIGKRSYGPDPALVSLYGVAYAKGLEAGGVISVAKHFPGHGSATTDSHKGMARLTRNITELDTMDLKPFRDYVNSGLSGVMAGHIQSLALDPDGKAASVSIDMLTHLLREEMGFKGLILTDAFNMGGAKGFMAISALKAGADIVLCPRDIKKEYLQIIEGIEKDSLDLSIINDRCRRILFYKYLFSIIKS